MRIIAYEPKKETIKLQVENLDDLWVLYNVVVSGDTVYAKTLRRVKRGNEEGRADRGERMPLYLGIRVKDVSFHQYSTRLRIKGNIISGPEDLVTIGGHHTLNVDVDDTIKIVKEKWTGHAIKRLEDAVKETATPQLLIVAIDAGEATIATASNYRLQISARITESLPGKRGKPEDHSQALLRFFSDLKRAIELSVSETPVDTIVLAGPGFTKENFKKYLQDKGSDLIKRITLETASSGDVNAINEVIKRGAASRAVLEMRITKETQLMEELLKRLGKGTKDVSYGSDEVRKAAALGAIESLLITDKILRESMIDKKEDLNQLLRSIERMGGKIVIISTLHTAGEQLSSLGGIAALLRYKIR
ncbi:MAG: mRNA surveillance protein pelota [Candidatus Hodarchaeota archaeon]